MESRRREDHEIEHSNKTVDRVYFFTDLKTKSEAMRKRRPPEKRNNVTWWGRGKWLYWGGKSLNTKDTKCTKEKGRDRVKVFLRDLGVLRV